MSLFASPLVRWLRPFLGLTPIISLAAVPADQPFERRDEQAVRAHQQLVAIASQAHIDLYFVGDSITRRWGGPDYPEFLAHWTKNFSGWNTANFGWGGDGTQNILWRLSHGELDGVNPKVIVLLAGTNNVGKNQQPETAAHTAADTAKGIKAIIDLCQAKAPEAKIILMAIFPRNDSDTANPVINLINEKIATFADGKRVRFLNINDQLADPSGRLHDGVSVDKLHLSVKGYEIWAQALRPMIVELLGPPQATGTQLHPASDGKPLPSEAGKAPTKK